jgi:hypothetical protein
MHSPVRTLTITVNNSSDAQLLVNYGQLTSGDWEDDSQPIPGSIISAGQKTYVTGADNAFEELKGCILLSPASGGSITIEWLWPRGSGVSDKSTSTSLSGLAVTHTVIDTQTVNPKLQVLITDSASLADLFAAKERHDPPARP